MSFVILLDQELAAHQNDWPISAEENTLDAIRVIAQHIGNPLLVPRRSRTMRRVEDKPLTDAQTGRIDAGAIYESANTQH